MEQQTKKTGMDPRITLILMVLLFVVPVAVAIVLHSIGDGWRAATTTNKGNLITPVRSLPAFLATSLDGKTVIRESLVGKWTMFYIDSSDCDKSCENNLYTIRQSRLGMGGEKDRVQRIMLLNGEGTGGSNNMLSKEHEGMLVLKMDKATVAEVLKTFEFDGLPAAKTAQRIYFIDPLGNLMMHYENDVNPRNVVKDLERLLKYSRIG